MGLDVSTKNEYVRFNWTGTGSFNAWSHDVLEASPFPGWKGANGEIIVFDKKEYEKEKMDEEMGLRYAYADPRIAQLWMEKFKTYATELGDDWIFRVREEDTARALGEMLHRGIKIGDETDEERDAMLKKRGFKKADREQELKKYEWEYLTGFQWYFLLEDALKNGGMNYF